MGCVVKCMGYVDETHAMHAVANSDKNNDPYYMFTARISPTVYAVSRTRKRSTSFTLHFLVHTTLSRSHYTFSNEEA